RRPPLRPPARVARRWPHPVRLGYLQFQHPRLEEVLVSLWQEGIREITVVPAFLSSGTHVWEDIPGILRAMRQNYPGLRLFLTAPLGYDPRLVEVLLDRVRGERKEVQ
ncbi:MAG: sirohydrochlorin chelatase, partial [Candidatus Caldatribacteriaceae bacterium]